jgi:hypothetical protein
MQELKAGSVTWFYVDQAFKVEVLEKDGYWGGRATVWKNAQEAETYKHALRGLDECFEYMQQWAADQNYVCGCIWDYLGRTIYYDTPQSRQAAETRCQSTGMAGYFVNFIQVQNWQRPLK